MKTILAAVLQALGVLLLVFCAGALCGTFLLGCRMVSGL